jgi:hypothetical protein
LCCLEWETDEKLRPFSWRRKKKQELSQIPWWWGKNFVDLHIKTKEKMSISLFG